MPLASQIELPARYRVTRHIASGGMASVWEAEDLLLGRTVAVKVLGSNFAADQSGRERFQREARTAAQVSDQPHIVTIYDIGEHADQAFIVMEYYGGGTVADRTRSARGAGERLPLELALRWLRDAAAGLDVAHAAGIVHRDVKPGNLMLDERDRLAVGDFGIARLADDTQMTQTGQVLGTAAYLSPEQAVGQPATPASDRYALAVVAYELLTGERPFSGGVPTAQARQHVEATPPRASQSAPDLPRAVDAVLDRALAKEPSQRPRSATAFVADLERALTPGAPATADPTRAMTPITPTRPTAVTPPRRARRRGPAALLAVAALLVVGIIALASGRDDNPSSPGAKTADNNTSPAKAKKSSPARTTAPAASEPPASASADPAALDAQGFALIKQERYAEAVPPERSAVDGFRAAGDRSSTAYSYALYNLGTALNRSGNPAESIPYLEERLAVSNDRRGVVEHELAAAQQAVGAPARDPGKKPKHQGGKKAGKGDE